MAVLLDAWDRSGAPDYYALLGVARDADGEIIRAAYLVLAKRYHPDTATAAIQDSVENFRLIGEAYEVLRDPDRRELYDLYYARQARRLAQGEQFEEARRQVKRANSALMASADSSADCGAPFATP